MEAKIVRRNRAMWCQGCQATAAEHSAGMQTPPETEEMVMLLNDARARTV
jgi:hypothetical protein